VKFIIRAKVFLVRRQGMYPFYEIRREEMKGSISVYITNGLSFPPHFQSQAEVVYVLEGNITIRINDKKETLTKGDIGVAFPNDVHSFQTEVESKVLIFIVSVKLISSYFNSRSGKSVINPFLKHQEYDPAIEVLMLMLRDEYEQNRGEMVIQGLLYAIFGKLDTYFIFKESSMLYDTTIQIVLSYIAEHYKENITLAETARKLGYSPYYISRVFNSKIGYRFNHYINSLRINMAQNLLRDTTLSVASIALECGFESLRNFNRAFKRQTNTTPLYYRKRYMDGYGKLEDKGIK
jgi:AraC-like DNA-binding protein/quercetin dioxygenase-like cupin family protein